MTDDFLRPPVCAADLTPRQLAVASLIARAFPDKHIAHELGISIRRVSDHVEALSYLIHADRALDVRIQIARWWWRQTPDLAA